MQGELLQICCTAEEGEGGATRYIGVKWVISSHMNLENVEEGEGPRSSFSESLNISPTVVNKAEAFKLSSPGAKQRQCVGTLQSSRGNIQSRASCPPKEGFYKEIALFWGQVQVGP